MVKDEQPYIAKDQLIQDAPDTEHVGRIREILLVEHFRCNVSPCAPEASDRSASDRGSKTEIANHQVAIFRDEDILGLDIEVHDALGMHVAHAAQLVNWLAECS